MKQVFQFFKNPISNNYFFDIKAKMVMYQDLKNNCYRIQHFDDLPYIIANTKYIDYKNVKLKWTLGSDSFKDSVYAKDNIYIVGRPLLQFNYDRYIELLSITINNCKFYYYKDDLYNLSTYDNRPPEEISPYYQVKVKKIFNETGYKTAINSPYVSFERINGSDENIYPFKKIKFESSINGITRGFIMRGGMNLMPFNTMYKGV